MEDKKIFLKNAYLPMRIGYQVQMNDIGLFNPTKKRNLISYLVVTLLSIAIFLSYVCQFQFNLAIPLIYQGDSVLEMAIFKALAQGDWWPYSVIRSESVGVPYTLNMGDFPTTETLHFGIVKFLTLFSQNPVILYNSYYLLTFPLTGIASLYVFKKLRFSTPISILLSICFSFLPFHLKRYSHLFLSAIFLIPLMSLVFIRLWGKKPTLFRLDSQSHFSFDHSHPKARFALMIAFLSGAYGIYYVAFFIFFLLVGGICSTLYRKSSHHLISAAILLLIAVGSTGLSALPYLIYRAENGRNPKATFRDQADAETYGLKMTYMLLPQENHRVKAFSKFRGRYVPASPKTEGFDESIGIFGTIGFIILLIRFLNPSFQTIYDRLKVLAFSAIFLSTVGGLGAIFSIIFSPLIRSYNRMSVFIAFFCLVALGAKLNSWTASIRSRTLKSYPPPNHPREALDGKLKWDSTQPRFSKETFLKKLIFSMSFLFFLFVAMIDQVTNEFLVEQKLIENQFLSDRNFVQMIEKALPEQTMILQLPFMEFPESGSIFKMEDYSHFRAFIHSKTLRWSYPIMKGRPHSEEMKELCRFPLDLKKIRSLGFGGIFIDRFGFHDHGIKIEEYLRGILNSAPMVSQDQRNLFFKI